MCVKHMKYIKKGGVTLYFEMGGGGLAGSSADSLAHSADPAPLTCGWVRGAGLEGREGRGREGLEMREGGQQIVRPHITSAVATAKLRPPAGSCTNQPMALTANVRVFPSHMALCRCAGLCCSPTEHMPPFAAHTRSQSLQRSTNTADASTSTLPTSPL